MRENSFIRPGYFSVQASADQMRPVYDRYNEQIVYNRMPIYFVFNGESITQFGDQQTYFGGTKDSILNRGISGDITLHMMKRFPADVLQLKPKYVHILGGTNNTWILNAVDPRERKSPDQIYQETNSKKIFPFASVIIAIFFFPPFLYKTQFSRVTKKRARPSVLRFNITGEVARRALTHPQGLCKMSQQFLTILQHDLLRYAARLLKDGCLLAAVPLARPASTPWTGVTKE